MVFADLRVSAALVGLGLKEKQDRKEVFRGVLTPHNYLFAGVIMKCNSEDALAQGKNIFSIYLDRGSEDL